MLTYRARRVFQEPGGATPGATVDRREALLGQFKQLRTYLGRASLALRPARVDRSSPPTPVVPAQPPPAISPPPAVTPPSVTSRDDEDVPRGLRIAAAWSWRLLILAVV